MKNIFSILAILTVVAIADGNVFERGEHIVCSNGEIRLARVPRLVIDEDFKGDSKFWASFDNFESKLSLEYSSSLKIRLLSGKGGDTAFGLKSRPVDVTPGSEFCLIVAACGNLDMSHSRGHGDLYNNEIIWLDAAGETIDKIPFAFNSVSKEPLVTKITGTVPKKTAKVVISIGADSPNLNSGSVFELTRLAMETTDDNCRLWPVGSFVSRPFLKPAPGVISWKADIPRGSSISVQLSSANDEGGAPGAWSSFCGPEWDADRAYMKSGTPLTEFPENRPWMRYKITLKADKKSPVVKIIRISDIEDSNWQGADSEAPVVIRKSPCLTQNASEAFVFEVKDNTTVDWRTFELFLDGKNMTTQVRRNASEVTFTPSMDLAPLVQQFENLEDWAQDNFKNNLRIEVLQQHGTVLRASRDGGQEDTMFEFISPKVSVRPKSEYSFSIDVRHNLPLLSAGAEKDAVARLVWFDGKGSKTGDVKTLFVPETDGWKNVTLTALAPENAATAHVSIGFDSPNIFDGKFFDCRAPKWIGEPGAPFKEQPNFHKFTVKIADLSGNAAIKDFFLLIDKPLTRNIVTLREDGCVLIDGRPFFPIGMYAVCKREFNGNDYFKAMEDLAKNGFNTVHTYQVARGVDYDEFLAASAKYNMKLFVSSSGGANCRDMDKILNDVVREFKHPQHLAWYLADDTASWIKPDELRSVHDFIKEIDPAHITVQADGMGAPAKSRYLAYVESTDGFLPEIYPITKDRQPQEVVPKVITDMMTIRNNVAEKAKGPKTIWPIIQYFDGWGGWPRFPTNEELRAMSYAALVHGANGITWYTYGGFKNNHGVTSTHESWDNICRLATEINLLQKVLVSRDSFNFSRKITSGPTRDAHGHDSISLLAKKDGSKRYLLCVNSTLNDITVEFKLDEAADEAKVLFENRSVPVRKQAFTDTFAPYGVHVYELKALFE